MDQWLSESSDIRESECDDQREVLVFYGLASLYAQSIEGGVVWLALLARVPEPLLLTEESLGNAPDQVRRKALERLIGALAQQVPVPDSLAAEIQQVFDTRKRLAHGFFTRHKQNSMSAAGRRMMIQELREMSESLSSTKQAIDGIVCALTGASHEGSAS